MSALVYIIGVFVCLIIWSIIGGITQRGAQREIAVRGLSGVGMTTIKVAEGVATTSDKFGIAVITVIGSLMSIPFILVSGVFGGLIYVVVHFITA